ncbi:MAG: alanine--tRNA ligase [Chloroflexi bacterium]|nr:alanine--tRNA ligase [Chloroflexota bacterium]
MPPRSSDDLRGSFIDFWRTRDAHLQPSSSLIPYNDPTVLLTTAGMQQFAPYFLGRETSPYPRYVSVQKCFRTSDIDEVGDRSHLTFFEMLGNFSVGDYFKNEVIPWALEFVTEHMGLERERLWITIHETDDEANEIWLGTGIPQQRIKRFGDEHNWWGPPGKSGPCGPNSELYYEQGPGFGCGFPEDPPGCDCGRLEFWNLVFMQYNQDERGVRTPLPAKNVDTGMGIERAAVVAFGLKSIYDTDLFRPLIDAAARLGQTEYGRDDANDYALRVLADHARAMTFLVLDGVVPGNTGRESVLRRIVRRAILYARRLKIQSAFVAHMVDAAVARMGDHYPELRSDAVRIKQVLSAEEELFERTLSAGVTQMERLIGETRTSGKTHAEGARVFDLFQTHGFPVELAEEMLREQGLEFSRAEYDDAFAAAREQARKGARFLQQSATGVGEFGGLPATEFLAWTSTQSDARILAVLVEGAPVRDAPTGARGKVVLEASPFYPEGGGQVGDTGRISTDEAVFEVEDTQLDGGGHIVHSGRVESGTIRVGEPARAEVDVQRRDRSRRHHTATHLLHRALKDVLGEGTSQQGSYVGPDSLRFDFNYQRAMSPEQLDEVAAIINDRGMDDLPVDWEIVPLDRARQMGAVMMFGEKYGDEVRVVSIGDYSRELCGGTHTHHSGELGSVLIAAEHGIGSGKRRIVAYAGRAALAHLRQRLETLESLATRVGARTTEELPQRIESLLEEVESLKRELQRRQQQQAHASAGQLAARARDVRGVKVVAEAVSGASRDELERMIDAVRQDLGSGVVVLGVVVDGRINFAAGVTRDLLSRVRAGDVIKEVAARAGGGGGGRPEFATGGGTQPERLGDALQHAFTVVDQALSSG